MNRIMGSIKGSSKHVRSIVPLLLLVVGLVIAFTLKNTGPEMKKPPAKIWKLPGVEIITVTGEDISIPVSTRGTVQPKIQIQLTSEVSGTIIKISDKLVNGAYFRKGEMLLKVDASRYELELNKVKAKLASAQHLLVKTKAATSTDEAIDFDIQRSDLARGKPQIQEALATHNAARSALRLAQRMLEKTTVVAPFDGRVASKYVNINEQIVAGKPIAKIYAIDSAEVRLPLSERQLALVDVPLRYEGDSSSAKQPNVFIEDTQHHYHWQGRIIRSEGSIDPRNRQTFVVTQIDAPYARDPEQPGRPPLTLGSFVEATIEGRSHSGIFSVPRKAIHNMNEIWTLDEDNRLHVKTVELLYRGKDRIYIKSGLENNSRIVLTPMKAVVDNMEVAISKEIEPLKPILTDDLFTPIKSINRLTRGTEKEPVKPSKPSKQRIVRQEPELTIDPKIMQGMQGIDVETEN